MNGAMRRFHVLKIVLAVGAEISLSDSSEPALEIVTNDSSTNCQVVLLRIERNAHINGYAPHGYLDCEIENYF